MSRPGRAQNMVPKISGSRFIDPTIPDLLIKSPCEQRPDTLMRCPIMPYSKDNRFCGVNCNLVNPNCRKKYTIDEMIDAIESGEISETMQNKGRPKPERKPCKWPHGCQNGAKVVGDYKDEYCTYHTQILRWRIKIWDESRWFEPVRVR